MYIYYVCVAAIRAFKVPDWVQQVILAGRVVCKHSVESFFDWFLDQKLQKALSEHKIKTLIDLLKGKSSQNNSKNS